MNLIQQARDRIEKQEKFVIDEATFFKIQSASGLFISRVTTTLASPNYPSGQTFWILADWQGHVVLDTEEAVHRLVEWAQEMAGDGPSFIGQ